MPPPYQLSVDGFAPDHFRVHSFRGKEAISEAWSFDLVVTAEEDDEIERAALGQRAVLLFNVGEVQRAFYGIVAAARLEQVHHKDHAIKYHLRVVPRLWLLRRKQRTRIFSKMRVPDIITAVLLEAGIAARWQLTRAYPEREYVTQYEETDYRFIRRLLTEAGIYFYFPAGPAVDGAALATDAAAAAGSSLLGAAASIAETLIPGDTVISGDDAVCYPPLRGDDAVALAASSAAALAPAVTGSASGASIIGMATAGVATAGMDEAERASPVLRFLKSEHAPIAKQDRVTRFSLANSVRSSAAVFRDYDPDRPSVRLQSAAVSTQPFPPSPFEVAAAAAAAAVNVATVRESVLPGAAALGQKVPSEVYEHHSPFLFPKWAFSSDEAPRILRQKRRRASIATGEGDCSDLCPGHRFTLQDHPASRLDGDYVVTSVEHRGLTQPEAETAWSVYSNTFECAPAVMTYVPPRPKRKSVQVSLTATVVGPPGEEIHVDAAGRIKVQFHWDREGRYDANSSCWIRTMQPWAGAGWGHQFIPRVGMEVVVVFEGGDPNKPMVLGTLYNGTHPPPFLVPQDKTRSGWRTQSSPGGSGFNELSFEDARGNEQVYLHAQKNLDEVVEKDHTLRVGNDEHIEVAGNRMDTVEKNHRRRVNNDEVLEVVGNRTTTIGKNLEDRVEGDHRTQVDGNRTDLVTGNADERVSGMLVTRVEGKERRQVQDAADLEYADDLTTRVKGSLITIVGRQDKKRSWVTHAEGTAELSGLDLLRLSSEKELVLSVGKSSIRITPDMIEVIAAAISATGGGAGLSTSDDGLALSSKGDARVMVKKKLVLQTEGGASLAMEKEVNIDGEKILLASPASATDPPPKAPDPPTKIALADQEGKPLGYQRFVVRLDDGTEVSGLTDKDGNAELDLPAGGKVVFPDVTMPGNEPKGDPKPYVVRQGDYLAKLAATFGFDADKVWNDPANAEVNAQRKNPNLLHPGDILRFPRAKRKGLPLAKGTTNNYAAKVPRTSISLGFKNAKKEPLANEPYVVEGLGAPVEGTTDGDGMLTIKVPVHLREVHVAFPKQYISHAVRIGDMDPIDEPAGVRKRLQQLGYQRPSEGLTEAELEARDRAAVATFQRAKGMDPTGLLDEATKAALVKEHGS